VDAEPITPLPPHDPGRTVFSQGWRQVAFLHWAVEPAAVAPLLPPRTRPDVLDGTTYVGLLGFQGVHGGVLGSPGLPYLGTFGEVNVRLYSVDDEGRRGIVFRSLDASRLLPVLVARGLARLPYRWSQIRLTGRGDRWDYRVRRRWPGPRGASGEFTVRVGERLADPSPLDLFLTARWRLHQTAWGRPLHWPVEHEEWPLHRAEVVHLADDLVAAAGVRVSGPPDSVLWSPGVDSRFGPRRPVGRAAPRSSTAGPSVG
jgi:uncharacterized protein YqjF (DUF2071 family)